MEATHIQGAKIMTFNIERQNDRTDPSFPSCIRPAHKLHNNLVSLPHILLNALQFSGLQITQKLFNSNYHSSSGRCCHCTAGKAGQHFQPKPNLSPGTVALLHSRECARKASSEAETPNLCFQHHKPKKHMNALMYHQGTPGPCE